MEQCRIIFFGSPQNAADLLAKLDKDPRFDVAAVVTQPDRPVGRKKTLTPTPVANYAKTHNIPTLKPERHPQKKHLLKNPNRFIEQIKNTLMRQEKYEGGKFFEAPLADLGGRQHSSLGYGVSRPGTQTSGAAGGSWPKGAVGNEFGTEKKFVHEESLRPDLILSYEFGQLIPQDVLSLARLGGLNIHFSLLPAYRGAAPIPWQIINNEKTTGISVVKISSKFDEGDIVYQKKYPIYPNDTQISLTSRLSNITLKIIPDLLADYASGNLPEFSILEREASYYPRLTRQHGFIPWKDFLLACGFKTFKGGRFLKAPLAGAGSGTVFGAPGSPKSGRRWRRLPKGAEQIERKVRALSPWPGVWTRISGKFLPAGEAGRVESGELKVESGKFNDWIKKHDGKRLKILEVKLKNGRLIPLKIQIEGEKPHLVYLTTT
jgi:methionyl-tRNA formyltransferase